MFYFTLKPELKNKIVSIARQEVYLTILGENDRNARLTEESKTKLKELKAEAGLEASAGLKDSPDLLDELKQGFIDGMKEEKITITDYDYIDIMGNAIIFHHKPEIEKIMEGVVKNTKTITSSPIYPDIIFPSIDEFRKALDLFLLDKVPEDLAKSAVDKQVNRSVNSKLLKVYENKVKNGEFILAMQEKIPGQRNTVKYCLSTQKGEEASDIPLNKRQKRGTEERGETHEEVATANIKTPKLGESSTGLSMLTRASNSSKLDKSGLPSTSANSEASKTVHDVNTVKRIKRN
ncbi:hypothetical protein OAC51_05435 [Flavobacteriaceae bacterium]|nr:hypothetical protein [Flavobacteriaceae bacterium]